MTTGRQGDISSLRAGTLAGLAVGLAALVLLPLLGSHGLWTVGELAVLDRTRAALGEPLADLQRSPWLPDALRTGSYTLVSNDLGLRLPGVLVVIGTCAVTAALARLQGASRSHTLLAAGFVLAFPITTLQARTLLGNPFTELCNGAFVLLGILAALPRARNALWFIAAAAIVLALGVSSGGIVLGGTLPVCALAFALTSRAPCAGHDHEPSPSMYGYVLPALWGATLVTIGIATVLAWRQGQGYIPLLGAAKDLELLQRPETHRFASTLEAFGYQMFPWLPIAVAGMVHPGKSTWASAWLLAGLAITTVWTAVYGSIALPLVIPCALTCVRGLECLRSHEHSRTVPALWTMVTVGGMLVMHKDAARAPAGIAAPLLELGGKHTYPTDDIGAKAILALLVWLAIAAVAITAVLSREGVQRRLAKLRWCTTSAIEVATAAIVLALLLGQAVVVAHVLVPRTSVSLSLRGLLDRYAHWVGQEQLPELLVTHRIKDAALPYYGPPPDRLVEIASRNDLLGKFAGSDPFVALVRKSEIAWLHHNHHQKGWPLYVLDNTHRAISLVANVLPEGAVDGNPILKSLFDTPPMLENETLVRFADYVEVVGWEIEGPVMRGSSFVARVLLRALRPMPSGSRVFFRLQKGKTSRINTEPAEIAQDVYPSHSWREGDYILHEQIIEVPLLEVLSGRHDVVVGLRRSEKDHYDISVPDGQEGEHGVTLRGKTRHYATIGSVNVW